MKQFACIKCGLRKDNQVEKIQRKIGVDIISVDVCVECGHPVDIVRSEGYVKKTNVYNLVFPGANDVKTTYSFIITDIGDDFETSWFNNEHTRKTIETFESVYPYVNSVGYVVRDTVRDALKGKYAHIHIKEGDDVFLLAGNDLLGLLGVMKLRLFAAMHDLASTDLTMILSDHTDMPEDYLPVDKKSE